MSLLVAIHCANLTATGPIPCIAETVYRQVKFESQVEPENTVAGDKISKGDNRMVTSAVLEATRIIFHVFCNQSLIKLIHRKSIFFGLLIRIPFVLQAIIVVEEAFFVSFFNKLF